jgi:hypothetical protein
MRVPDGVSACHKRGPLLQPSPRNIPMDEDILADFDAAPVTDLDGKRLAPWTFMRDLNGERDTFSILRGETDRRRR